MLCVLNKVRLSPEAILSYKDHNAVAVKVSSFLCEYKAWGIRYISSSTTFRSGCRTISGCISGTDRARSGKQQREHLGYCDPDLRESRW